MATLKLLTLLFRFCIFRTFSIFFIYDHVIFLSFITWHVPRIFRPHALHCVIVMHCVFISMDCGFLCFQAYRKSNRLENGTLGIVTTIKPLQLYSSKILKMKHVLALILNFQILSFHVLLENFSNYSWVSSFFITK